MAKLEKEMEKDAKTPYVPYKEQKKKMQKEEEDPNKIFLEKLDKELQNEDKYKPSEHPKKVVKPNLKKDFETTFMLSLFQTVPNSFLCFSCEIL